MVSAITFMDENKLLFTKILLFLFSCLDWYTSVIDIKKETIYSPCSFYIKNIRKTYSNQQFMICQWNAIFCLFRPTPPIGVYDYSNASIVFPYSFSSFLNFIFYFYPMMFQSIAYKRSSFW